MLVFWRLVSLFISPLIRLDLPYIWCSMSFHVLKTWERSSTLGRNILITRAYLHHGLIPYCVPIILYLSHSKGPWLCSWRFFSFIMRFYIGLSIFMIFINLLGVFTIFILLNESFIFVSLPNSPSHMSIWIKKNEEFF
jgi:hypothetical protein